MPTLNEIQLRSLANRSGVQEKAVMRLLGSLQIPLPRRDDPTVPMMCDIGLRIDRPDVIGRPPFERLLEIVAPRLKDFAVTCPIVVAWIGRGDFNPEKLPERATPALIRHAAVTSGRLRARILRELGCG